MNSQYYQTDFLERRQILLFVSSTFRDLEDERDELVSNVFPRIRAFCRQRSVLFAELDLRWGITLEQAKSQQIVPRCFHEIERSHPFFLGIIGDRYGWVPSMEDDVPRSCLESYPWLKEFKGTSVTEMEFIHGVFNRTTKHDLALFYSRRKPGEQSETNEEAAEYRNKLELLKGKLRESTHLFREGFESPQTLGEWVYQDLTRRIDRLFPTLGDARIESSLHQFEAEKYRVGFAGRDAEKIQLQKTCQRDRAAVVLRGQPGIGKSALLANWFLDLAEDPQRYSRSSGSWLGGVFKRSSDKPCIRVIRFHGACNKSSNSSSLVMSIIREIHDRLNMERSLPKDSVVALAEFESWLEEAGKIVDLLIVVTRIDGFEPDPTRLVSWVPKKLPKGVRLIVSADSDEYVQKLDLQTWQAIEIGNLSREDTIESIGRTLRYYGKQVSSIEDSFGAIIGRSPRFVRTVLEELRVHGQFGEAGEQLERKLNWYLESQSEPELLQRVFARWESEYDQVRPKLVADALSMLLLSQHGIEESEVPKLLQQNGESLARIHWTAFQAAAEHEIMGADGKLSVRTHVCRQTVRQRFLKSDDVEASYRRRLAEFFRRHDSKTRQADELLWQWAALGQWNEIASWILDAENLVECWDTHEYVLKSYWRQSCLKLGLSSKELFLNCERLSGASPNQLVVVCQFLGTIDLKEEATHISTSLLDRENILSKKDLQEVLGVHGFGHLKENPQTALEAFQRQEKLCRELELSLNLAACLGSQATVFRNMERHEDSLRLHQQEESICRQFNELRMLAGCLNNLAQVLILTSDFGGAEKRLDELESLAQALRDPGLLGRCHESRALCLVGRNKLSRGFKYFEHALAAFQSAEEPNRQALCHVRFAEAQYNDGDLDAAIESLAAAEQIAFTTGDHKLAERIEGNRDRILQQFEI